MIELLATRWAYATFVFVMATGLYMMIASPNLVKKVIGLNLFQSAVFLFFVALALIVRIYREYGTLDEGVLREVVDD